MNNTIPLTLAGIDDEGLILVLGIGFLGVIIFIVHSIRKICEVRAKEQTKRDFAAYVAEGSITAADANQMLMSGSDAAEQISSGVAWGTVKPEKAEQLLRALRNDPASAGKH
ncbi:MAG: hypothetical protein JNK25_14545 [Phycisphaerae bacterium]|nr:hypothetical protein [Phycisphaerae bacterium]